MSLHTLLLIAVFSMLVPCAHAALDAWPQFRGPSGDGIVGDAGVPLTWSETQNVKWKTAVPGEGWSSPVIGDGVAWMTTSTGNGKSLRTVAVSIADGKVLHDMELIAVEAPKFKHKLNSYASPSPILDKGKLYCHFGVYGTVCVDTKTAKILWRNDDIKINHENGPGSTPVLHKGKLIVCCDGSDQQYLFAMDAETGKMAWKTERSQKVEKVPDMRKAYGTPQVIHFDGIDQLINPAAEYCYSHDPETGKELWYIKYPGYSNVPRPVFGGGMLYIATGFDRPEMWGVKPGKKGETGNLTATHVVWRNKIQAPAQPSPLFLNDRLYMISDKGMTTCMKAATGDVLWKEQVGAEASASPTFIDNRIYFCDRLGLTTVIEPGDALKVLAKNTLESGFMASPAVIGKALFLRTKTHLYRIEQ